MWLLEHYTISDRFIISAGEAAFRNFMGDIHWSEVWDIEVYTRADIEFIQGQHAQYTFN